MADRFSSHARIVAQGQPEPPRRVDDLPRAAIPAGDPPVPGAQWDELHGRWEQWDEEAGAWVVVGDGGDGAAPADENPLPPLPGRHLHHADELDLRDGPAVIDVRRFPEPETHVPGAQWNEVLGRWERWDEARNEWMAVADA